MTEIQKTLKALEQRLCALQVSGRAAIVMGDALKLLITAQDIADKEAKAAEGARKAEERQADDGR